MKKKISSHQIKMIHACSILVVLFASATAHAQSLDNNTLTNLTFDQKLDAQVSRELQFRDEHGNAVTLADLSNRKPVILMLGYYECPMLCDLALNGLVESIQNLRWSIGTEFEVINVSIDARETPALALAKKRSYVRRYGRDGAENGWHFLTGDEAAIQQLAREIGFQYAYDSAVDEFAHPAGFVVLTPDGKVARYFFGVQYPPTEVLAALKSAAENKISSPIQQLVYLCFRYNPIGGKYGAIIMLALRIGGAVTLAGMAWLIVRANRTRRKRLKALAGQVVDANCSRRGDEADSFVKREISPPHVGGYQQHKPDSAS